MLNALAEHPLMCSPQEAKLAPTNMFILIFYFKMTVNNIIAIIYILTGIHQTSKLVTWQKG